MRSFYLLTAPVDQIIVKQAYVICGASQVVCPLPLSCPEVSREVCVVLDDAEEEKCYKVNESRKKERHQ